MDVDGFVSTPEIASVGDIDLQNPGTYQIVDLGPGVITHRRRAVSSPYVHGDTIVGAVKESVTMTLTILVEGDDSDDLAEKTSVLLRAFEQFRYRVGLTLDGVDYEWYCGPANYRANNDGLFRASHYRAHVQVYTFQIPRDPIPIEGTH